MILLPPFYGNTILMICTMTQHAGLAENVKDHRKSTRTVILNPFLVFYILIWNIILNIIFFLKFHFII